MLVRVSAYLYCAFKTSSHSASLNPTRTKLSPTRSGSLTSIPSEASRRSISSLLVPGNLFFGSEQTAGIEKLLQRQTAALVLCRQFVFIKKACLLSDRVYDLYGCAAKIPAVFITIAYPPPKRKKGVPFHPLRGEVGEEKRHCRIKRTFGPCRIVSNELTAYLWVIC